MLRYPLTVGVPILAPTSSTYQYCPAQRNVLILFLIVITAGTVFGITLAAAVLVITWMTTARQVLRAFSLGMKPTLSAIILRDGTSIASVAVYTTNGIIYLKVA